VAADRPFTLFASRISKLNITPRSVTEPIDDTPTGKLVEGILSTIVQFENDEKAVRTKRGMKEALERGSWPFPVSLDYLKIPQPDGRVRVVPDPETAPLIKQAFELFRDWKYDRAEVLRIATAAGLRTKKGKKLSPQSFHNMLKNPWISKESPLGKETHRKHRNLIRIQKAGFAPKLNLMRFNQR